MQASIPTNWRRVKLGDHLSVLTDYHANGSYERLKANVELLDTPSYAVMIRTKNFEQNNFQDDLKYITKPAYDFLQKSKVKPGDILMNKIANAGSIYYMPDLKRPVSLAMNLFLLRTKEEDAHQKYVFYYLKANETYIKNFATGTAATTITKQAVRELQIFLPSLPEQKTIAQILGALDDKIELNREMNKTLEAIAQAIFKSWFVDFDPVRAKMEGRQPAGMDAATAELFPDEFEESTLGLIPKGWKVIKLGNLIDIKHGYAFKGEFFRTEPPGDVLLTPGNFAIGGGFKDDKFKYYVGEVPEDFVFDEGDLLVTMTDLSKAGDTLGYPAIIPVPRGNRYLHNQRLGKIIIKRDALISKLHLYYLLRLDAYRNEVLASATGTTVKHTSPDRIKAFEFPFANNGISLKFEQVISSLICRISLNDEQSRTLASIRDTLLPKLLSGEIRVKEAEKIAAKVM
ncbi:restriction endonuclease subunit S [Brunnivagina elsteri]|nr:restriction endonuclease subunit S [Calothrix elsteri]